MQGSNAIESWDDTIHFNCICIKQHNTIKFRNIINSTYVSKKLFLISYCDDELIWTLIVSYNNYQLETKRLTKDLLISGRDEVVATFLYNTIHSNN